MTEDKTRAIEDIGLTNYAQCLIVVQLQQYWNIKISRLTDVTEAELTNIKANLDEIQAYMLELVRYDPEVH